jgi:hypothetical protein
MATIGKPLAQTLAGLGRGVGGGDAEAGKTKTLGFGGEGGAEGGAFLPLEGGGE